ncbi:ATP-binding protein [Seohaeicola zhoushanensis]|uniref:histidine kinase n=1 Tax=Seohaeicola zhoushanensis TaxID=1569283 RepID=A0A8J3GZW1_9RHOB|nr:ATP-binding protein [Seohaeicola zhoushanensis]GHF58424.1 two-component sensor histidine kinase [Seohaeicola zhoushanensis]
MADFAGDLLEALPVPALLIGRDARISAANSAARALLGQQITGRHHDAILRQPEMARTIAAGMADGQPRQIRVTRTEGAQTTLWEVSVRPAGSAGALLVTLVDATPLEQASQMRRDFVANVSHELRTPLTALLGFIETLRGAAARDPAARERFLGIMANEANRMNRLVGDLLSLSRVESQERIRPKDPVDLGALLTDVLKALKPLADDSKVRFDFQPPEQGVTIPGDADQLRQVFTNLIENAIKYGGSGGVVTVTLAGGDEARVVVSDNGPGIDPVHLPRLTERFYRADTHRSRMLGGTGLGLAIVKHIVNRHRGRLKVASEPGQGAAFTVVLPFA